ncbi:MAG: 16S rRNA (guanine(966)-N(2))-methyltransferase RsmD [Planctomycetaceae bacterium]|jgi:16S rRNA (guanine966-N2)-methyltransferase|nr:16S rRNA (guanine(966)-N(2))-methyltransferase RsmD [Planctomycetaceae bacterium]
MRIIRGRFGRRKLLSNPGDTTRPITDKVKESLFEYLEDEIQGMRVADIFAGTGTIGLESLSRGANSVVFFERDRKAVELLRKNVASLKVEDETLCWATDVLKTSFRPKNCEGMTPFDVAFFDPPYKMVPDILPGKQLFKSLERLAREDVTSDDALLVFRTPGRAEFQLPDAWRFERKLEYSRMEVHWFRKQAQSANDEAMLGETQKGESEPEDRARDEAAEESLDRLSEKTSTESRA